MTSGYILVGEIDAAGDLTTAANIRTDGSETQTAIDERVEVPAQAGAAAYLASQPGVEAAAAAAVTTEIGTRSLVESAKLGRGNQEKLGIAITFEDDSRTALEVDEAGRPTQLSAELHVEAEAGLMGDALGVETRTDVAMPGVDAIFAYEDDSIFGTVGTDGSVSWVKQSAGPVGLGYAALGDSTTFGAGLSAGTRNAQRWTALLGALIGQPIANYGLSGSKAGETSAFMGGRTIRGTINGGVLPASGYAEIGAVSTNPWASGNTDAWLEFAVVAVTDDGQVIPGVFSRPISGGAYLRFTRTDASPVAITSKYLEMRSTLDTSVFRSFVGTGTNNITAIAAGTQTIDKFLADLEELTGGLEGDYFYWGFVDRGYSERPGTVAGDIIDELERRIPMLFGSRYLPVRAYLASSLALEDAKIFNPSFAADAADTQAVGVGRIPPCFQADGLHLNPLGHQLQARFFHRHLILRGLA